MKKYEITKCDANSTKEYGIWSEEDMKLIVRGYKWNGMFYERKGSKSIFIVNEVK